MKLNFIAYEAIKFFDPGKDEQKLYYLRNNLLVSKL